MYKYILLVFICNISTSCATMFNGDKTKVYIHAEKPTTIIYRGDTVSINKNKSILLHVSRGNETLIVKAKRDTLENNLFIPSKLSSVFFINLCTPLCSGLLLDYNSDRKYTYPRNIYLSDNLSIKKKVTTLEIKESLKKEKIIHDTYVAKNLKQNLTEKGDLYFNINFPYFNFFSVSVNDKIRDNSDGFIGIGGGFDYYYKRNRFINFTTAVAINFLAPVPAPVDYFGGTHTHIVSTYGTLSHNHRIPNWSFGYGLAYTGDKYYYRDYDFDGRDIDVHNNSLGFIFNTYYYLSNSFYAGVNYRPTFIRLNSDADKTLRYEHLISVEFGFKIRLSKRKKQ